jgi:hypothetical protein
MKENETQERFPLSEWCSSNQFNPKAILKIADKYQSGIEEYGGNLFVIESELFMALKQEQLQAKRKKVETQQKNKIKKEALRQEAIQTQNLLEVFKDQFPSEYQQCLESILDKKTPKR